MDTLWIAIAILATWRLSFMLTRERGPFDSMVTLRTWIYKIKGVSDVADCLFCASVWIGILSTALVLIPYLRWWLVPFALSGGAMLIDGLFRSHDESHKPPAS